MIGQDERIDLTVRVACQTSPELDPDAASTAIEIAARSSQERNRLAAFLTAHSDGLSSGLSSGPAVVGRVVDALRTLGAVNMAKPHCAICECEKRLPYHHGNGRICTNCFTKVTAKQCARCGRTKPVCWNAPDGPVCSSCRARDTSKHEPCGICGQIRPVTRRTKDGPVCARCYERPSAVCDLCGRTAKIHSRRSGSALCNQCYSAPSRLCGKCGELGVIARRADSEGGVDVCFRCYTPRLVNCVDCGRRRRCVVRAERGALCQACAPRPVKTCSRCGDEQPVHQRSSDGPICSRCYEQTRRVPCHSCRVSCRPYERGECARCVLSARVNELLGESEIRAELEPLVVAIRGTSQPATMLRWLRRSEGARVLSQLARGEIELSHDGLDALPRTKPLDHLRGLLVATGVLPETSIEFDRLEHWLDELLADVPAKRAQMVQAFARWCVFRRARRKAIRNELGENGIKWARLRVRLALNFLGWLEVRDVTLEDLRQEDVDLWLAGGPTTRYVVRDFLAWARERRLAPKVSVPLRQTKSPSRPVNEDERWDQVDRLLSDDGVEVDVRVAGLFALLFGQHLSRVCRLRREDLVVDADRATVSFGDDALVLPPVLDRLVLSLLDRRGHAAIRGKVVWLFPGGTPGRPITAEHFRGRLADVGIILRPTRQAALMQLAAELPAPVLADLLGLHDNTAVEWVRAARGDWSAYAATGPTVRRPRNRQLIEVGVGR